MWLFVRVHKRSMFFYSSSIIFIITILSMFNFFLIIIRFLWKSTINLFEIQTKCLDYTKRCYKIIEWMSNNDEKTFLLLYSFLSSAFFLWQKISPIFFLIIYFGITCSTCCGFHNILFIFFLSISNDAREFRKIDL